MRYVLDNGKYILEIDNFGAEMKSFREKDSGLEYLWSGDPAYWNGVSPLLFPFIGCLRDGTYRYQGKEYVMGQHGFARSMEFAVSLQEKERIIMEITDTEETRVNYPFPFRLEVEYVLETDGLKENWRVHNTGGETMYFSIGGHPALACPPGGNGMADRNSCSVRLLGAEDCESVDSLCVVPGGLLNGKTVPVENPDGRIPITDTLFSIDTILLQNKVHGAALCGEDGRDYIYVESDAPVWGIWSKENRGAAYICIEPWFGLCDYADFQGSIGERPFTNHVEAGAVWEGGFKIGIPEGV